MLILNNEIVNLTRKKRDDDLVVNEEIFKSLKIGRIDLYEKCVEALTIYIRDSIVFNNIEYVKCNNGGRNLFYNSVRNSYILTDINHRSN